MLEIEKVIIKKKNLLLEVILIKKYHKTASDSKGEVGKQPYYLSVLENDKSDYDKKVSLFF